MRVVKRVTRWLLNDLDSDVSPAASQLKEAGKGKEVNAF